MVARPSGSWVSLTWACRSTRGQNLLLDKLGVAAGHGVVLEAAFAALRVSAAVADGDGDLHGNFVLGDQAVERGEERACPEPSAPTMKGATVPGTYCFGT